MIQPGQSSTNSAHIYEVRPRKDKRGVDLISDALLFGRLWYDGPQAVANAIGYAMHRSRSHDAVIRVYDDAGNVIGRQRLRRPGHFRRPRSLGPGLLLDRVGYVDGIGAVSEQKGVIPEREAIPS